MSNLPESSTGSNSLNSVADIVAVDKETASEPDVDTVEVDSPSGDEEEEGGGEEGEEARVEEISRPPPPRADGKIVLTEKEAYQHLGFSYPTSKKWGILSVIFIVQVSMNFNTSVYANAIKPLAQEFGITERVARLGQMIFLIAYAFGSELWAPWSEELGRWKVLQSSLFLVNVWQIPCALAPNFTTIMVGRFLGGLSSAGGSVTLGMVADMWEANDQQYAVAFIVFSSVGGSVVGPIVGGYIQTYLSWHWVFWVQLIFGVVVQLIHAICVPETRTISLLDAEARRRREEGEKDLYGPGEVEDVLTRQQVIAVWLRPFIMFFNEPIVLFLSLLSGFSDALIFTFLESFQPVFKQWNFSTIQIGLAFSSILIGYVIGYFSFFPFIRRHSQIRKKDPHALRPEARLYWLLYTAPLETIGLFGFAWTCLGPPHSHWIAPLIFSTLIAIANYCIYMATIDYMIASYGPFAASATGGNALARDFLAGVAALYSTPFYEHVGQRYRLEWPTTILACLAFLVTIPIYVFYWKGPEIRRKSTFAQTLASDRRKGILKAREPGDRPDPETADEVDGGGEGGVSQAAQEAVAAAGNESPATEEDWQSVVQNTADDRW